MTQIVETWFAPGRLHGDGAAPSQHQGELDRPTDRPDLEKPAPSEEPILFSTAPPIRWPRIFPGL